MVQATGGSAVIAIGSGCVSDIATPEERGKYMGLFSALSMAGPAIGPVLGGILSFALSWRWIFWILAIGCGASLIAIIFFLPETLRSIVGDGSLPKPWYNRRPQESLKLREEAKNRFGKGILPPEEVLKLQRKKFKPLQSFRMLLFPDVILMLLYSSLIYAQYYCVLTVYSQLLKKNYGYNDIQIGLCYLSNGVGAMAMAFGIGRFLDWDFKRAKKALGFNPNGAISLDGFPIEKTRLRVFPYVVGCLIGAGATSVIDPVINAIGEGWAFTLFSGIIIVLTPMPIILVKKGPSWRKARVDAAKRKQELSVKPGTSAN
ncbi:hypothetical protein QFC19_001999 [Naganishia cerealis]|uniref:Uncharacterized protein n=1 Tax=Naganishia cerealis TaxID=610337 RepID=A0ACC2WF06_9TREE|nr:hypothetical protein QFC19_001999 [Naganishia cerealis]